MQSLLGGADCATSSNPLKQVAQREGVDNSLFRDRFAPTSGPVTRHPFRPHKAPGPTSSHLQSTPHPFNLSHLSAALASPPNSVAGPSIRSPHHSAVSGQFESSWTAASSRVATPPPPSRVVAPSRSTFTVEHGLGQTRSDWADAFHPGKGKARAMITPPSDSTFHTPGAYQGYRPYMPTYGQSTFDPMYSGHNQVQMPEGGMIQQMGLQRSGQEQKDMEAAFERALEDARVQQRAETVHKEEGEEVEEVVREGEPKGDFEAVWESLRPEAERLNKLSEWERDFSQFVDDKDDLYDTLNESLNRDVGQTGLEDQMEFGTGSDLRREFEQFNGMPKPREYDFTLPNRFDTTDPSAAWTEANRILIVGGSLADASLFLESFIRRATSSDLQQPGSSEIEAWSLLGRTHAMNEKEEKALSAFEEGRKLIEGVDPHSPGIGEMLTNLAISYVNESYDQAALTTLAQLLSLVHRSYADPSHAQPRAGADGSPWALHQEMTGSYLNLAREQYNHQGKVDPDVQVGLGTLYYMQGEYGEARDCWVAALEEKPDDYLLWNRLGATLANGGNPEEAVDAYRRALELKPTFTRAIFNLGVACLNIGVHREAAEHFLAALSLHDRGAGEDAIGDAGMDDSASLWMTLRRALVALDMLDLADKARPGMDLGVFRRAGLDF